MQNFLCAEILIYAWDIAMQSWKVSLEKSPKNHKKRYFFNAFSSNFTSDEYFYLKSTTQFLMHCFFENVYLPISCSHFSPSLTLIIHWECRFQCWRSEHVDNLYLTTVYNWHLFPSYCVVILPEPNCII